MIKKTEKLSDDLRDTIIQEDGWYVYAKLVVFFQRFQSDRLSHIYLYSIQYRRYHRETKRLDEECC